MRFLIKFPDDLQAELAMFSILTEGFEKLKVDQIIFHFLALNCSLDLLHISEKG